MNTLRPKTDFEEKTQYVKEFNVQNKDRILEYQKIIVKKDIDKIKVKLNEKHKCICGGCFTTVNKSHHFKTKKHLKYIQENEL